MVVGRAEHSGRFPTHTADVRSCTFVSTEPLPITVESIGLWLIARVLVRVQVDRVGVVGRLLRFSYAFRYVDHSTWCGNNEYRLRAFQLARDFALQLQIARASPMTATW